MAAALRSRGEVTGGVQGNGGGSGAEAAASRAEDAVAANVLEHYIRFRSKAEDASFKGWLELLKLTMPKLEVRIVTIPAELVLLFPTFPSYYTPGTCWFAQQYE